MCDMCKEFAENLEGGVYDPHMHEGIRKLMPSEYDEAKNAYRAIVTDLLTISMVSGTNQPALALIGNMLVDRVEHNEALLEKKGVGLATIRTTEFMLLSEYDYLEERRDAPHDGVARQMLEHLKQAMAMAEVAIPRFTTVKPVLAN